MRAADERMDWNPTANRKALEGACCSGSRRAFAQIVPVEGATPMQAPASWRATGDVTDRAMAAGKLRVVHRTNG